MRIKPQNMEQLQSNRHKQTSTMDTTENGRKRMRGIQPNTEDVLRKAREIWQHDPNKSLATATEDRNFREHFGCSVLIFLTVWNMLVKTDFMPVGGRIEHMLWALLFMKEYCKQKVLCSMCGGIDKETLMKWVCGFVSAIVDLESLVVSHRCGLGACRSPSVASSQHLTCCQQIIWDNRFKLDKGNDCLVSVDGTDFQIAQKGPIFSSHKFSKTSGLRCEVALCILTGDIVWINGPCECGMWPDLSIF